MILTCPACATSYFIPDDAVGSNGRKVRCQSCGEVWRATSDEPLELTLAPEPSLVARAEPEPETASLAETPAPELPRAFRARAEQQRRIRRAAAHGVVWAGMASVFVGLIASAFLFRVEVVDAFPRAAAAYAMVGAPVNPIGLDFEAMGAKEAPNHPGMVLVSGALRNVRDAEIVAPAIRVSLLDDHGAEVGFRVVEIDAAPVLPGKVQGFATLIPDPGGHAADIGVNFVTAETHSAPKATHAPPSREAAEPQKDHAASAHEAAPSSAPHAASSHASAPVTAAAHGLRSATAPGVGGHGNAAPLEARAIPVVDSPHGEAVSASHHG
jgi:predicted Zn finger-like uncharacterized protein